MARLVHIVSFKGIKLSSRRAIRLALMEFLVQSFSTFQIVQSFPLSSLTPSHISSSPFKLS
jgi:hypothetical protein